MGRFRRLAVLLAVIAPLLASAQAQERTGADEGYGVSLLENLLSTPGRRVDIQGFDLDWPLNASARRIQVSDDQGVWLSVERPRLVWHPSRLTARVIDIDQFSAEQVVVHREPLAAPDDASSQGGEGVWRPKWIRLGAIAVPIRLEALVAGNPIGLHLSGRAEMRREGGVVDINLRSDAGAIARLAGTAGFDHMDLRWYLRIPSMARWETLAGLPLAGELVGHGVVAGRLPNPAISGRMEVGQGSAATLSWSSLAVTLRAIPEPGIWRLGLVADVAEPRVEKGRPLLPSAELRLAADLTPGDGVVRIGTARLAGPGFTASAAGDLFGWGRQAFLTVEGEIRRLDAVGGGDMAGHLRLRGQVAGDVLARRLDGVFNARARDFAIGDPEVDRLLGPTPKASAALSLSGETLRVHGLRVEGRAGSLWTAGKAGRRLGLWTIASVPDLSALLPELRGAATARGRVEGEVGSPAITGTLSLREVVSARLPPASGELAFALQGEAGSLAADLTVAGHPLTGTADMRLFSTGLAFDAIRLRSGGSTLAGALSLEPEGLRGRLSGTVPRLQDWAGLLGLPLAGRFEAEAVLDPAEGQSLSLSARGARLSGFGASAGQMELSAAVSGLTGTPTGRATIIARTLRRGGATLNTAMAQLEGGMEELAFQLSAGGTAVQPAGLAAGGVLWLEEGGRAGRVRLDRLRFLLRGVEARLTEPAAVLTWHPDGLRLEPTTLELAGGRVAVRGAVEKGDVEAAADLAGLPLKLVELALPGLGTAGAVDGRVTVSGRMEDPVLAWDLRGSRVAAAMAARAGLRPLDASFSGRAAGGRAEASLEAQDGERLDLRAQGSFPLDLTGGGPVLPPDGAISAQLLLNGELARLTEAVPQLVGNLFAGRLNGQLAAEGTVAAPLLSGRLSLAEGRYENLDQGTIVTDLGAEARLDGQSVAVTASGRDGGQGTVSVRGGADLAGTWEGQVVLAEFHAVRRDDLRAEVSGELTLAGEGGAGRIAGALRVPEAELDLGRLRSAGPVELQVVEINRPGSPQMAAAGEVEPAPPDGRGGGEGATALALDLGIDLTVERAFVRGRGLDSVWQGDLKVGGTVEEPSLAGRLTAERGEYAFLGRTFRLTRDSAVSFEGGTEPRLAVLADAPARDITARVEVTGTASAPDLAFTSDPPLPKDEILSRILFEQEAGRLSAFQQIQLARIAASGLTPGEDGFDPIGGIRGALGLDVLDVGGGDEGLGGGGPTLSAGKYIGDDTFLRVEQGTQGLGSVTVERELGGGFSVETQVGQGQGSGVGLNWRKDY